MNTIIYYLYRLLVWLIKVSDHPHYVLIVPEAIWSMAKFAKPLCVRQDRTSAPGTSGEYKRDQVFQQMHNTYASARPYDIYMAILLARGGHV